MGLHQTKELLHMKGNNTGKRQLFPWEKTDKGIILKIYREFHSITRKQPN
jgi:hypothetical protein